MTRFRSIALTCALLALAPGCIDQAMRERMQERAQLSHASERRMAREQRWLARDQAREREQERSEEMILRMPDSIRSDLAAFEAGPAGACDSPALSAAMSNALLMAQAGLLLTQRGHDAAGSANAQAAGYLLDVADSAAGHGCPEVARVVYRNVIKTYTGLIYTAYRQRAEIGLAELREGTR